MPTRPTFVRPPRMGTLSLRKGPFYTVASVELGNTTTKCVVVTTDLRTARMYMLGKLVRLTREARPPREGELVFGRTLTGTPLTRESVAELVAETLTGAVRQVRLDIERDLHFVVRSTGVTAGFATPSEVGEMVRALAQGCLQAGIPPRKMTASISLDRVPPGLRRYSLLDRVYFDGAVAGTRPPAATEIVANEMEGELVTAGLKGAAKNTQVDFRNPVMTLDFGTTLAGRVTDESYPYADTIGSFAGLGGAIPDALVRGAGLADPVTGCVLDVEAPKRYSVEVGEWLEKVHSLVDVRTVPAGTTRFGTVPVDTRAADESGVVLIGVDAGRNGSALSELERLGAEVYEAGGLGLLMGLVDRVQVQTVQRLVSTAEEEGIVLPRTALGLTGRGITTGTKPRLVTKYLTTASGEPWTESHVLLMVEDGLALGAAVAARCMNSMGTPKHPIGGRQGDGCVLAARREAQKGRTG